MGHAPGRLAVVEDRVARVGDDLAIEVGMQSAVACELDVLFACRCVDGLHDKERVVAGERDVEFFAGLQERAGLEAGLMSRGKDAAADLFEHPPRDIGIEGSIFEPFGLAGLKVAELRLEAGRVDVGQVVREDIHTVRIDQDT